MDFKTPVSLLQEYLVKENVLPIYTLISSGNGTHINIFQYEVKAKGKSAIGSGNSKKEAKHEAAKLLLLKLNGKEIWEKEIPIVRPNVQKYEIPSNVQKYEIPSNVQKNEASISSNVSVVNGNSIGALQEFCVVNNFSYPHYEFIKDEGDLINHLFVVRCTVASLSAEGRASNKQQAKHLAAHAVLKRLQGDHKNVINTSAYKVIENQVLTTKACEKTLEAFQKTLHERQDRPISSMSTMKNLLNFADHFKSKIGPRSPALQSIKDMDEDSIEGLEKPEGLLNSIMKELDHELKFEFLNTKNQNHCLCNLVVTELHINCIGIGKTNSDAKRKAVINTLKILVIMFKS